MRKFRKNENGELTASLVVAPGSVVRANDMEDLRNKVTKAVYEYLGRSLEEMINGETSSPEITLQR
jgi:hypothetical protein